MRKWTHQKDKHCNLLRLQLIETKKLRNLVQNTI